MFTLKPVPELIGTAQNERTLWRRVIRLLNLSMQACVTHILHAQPPDAHLGRHAQDYFCTWIRTNMSPRNFHQFGNEQSISVKVQRFSFMHEISI